MSEPVRWDSSGQEQLGAAARRAGRFFDRVHVAAFALWIAAAAQALFALRFVPGQLRQAQEYGAADLEAFVTMGLQVALAPTAAFGLGWVVQVLHQIRRDAQMRHAVPPSE